MRRSRLALIYAFTLGVASCGTTTTVEPSIGDQPAVEEETEDSIDESEDSEEIYPEDTDADADAAAQAESRGAIDGTEVLEPANALLSSIDGWTAVDNFYWEPIGFEPSSDCAPLNEILALEDWGIPTGFWLREGDELWQHAADLNTEANVGNYLAAVDSIATSCPTASFGGGSLSFEPLSSSSRPGFGLTTDENTSATWMFEAGRTSRSIAIGRANTVVLLTLVAEDFDENELDRLMDAAEARLASIPPE